MTEEIYNELMGDYERQLYTAKELSFVSFKNLKHKQRLSEIYVIIFNRKSGMMSGCGRCALRETREIAEVYYKEQTIRVQKEKTIRVQKELEPKEDKVVDTQAVMEIKPKKRATKKKKK